LRLLTEHGYDLVVVVTNQTGITRGYYGAAGWDNLHRFVADDLASHGHAVAVYHCPHHPDFGDVRPCDCRKPGAGMLSRHAIYSRPHRFWP
jgi:D-glycero-D-manno-heptose 1,7-bisphosphate phosphatase